MRVRPQPAKALIVDRGDTQTMVAAAIDVAPTTLRHLLSGQVKPWPAVTDRLAAYLSVEPDELWRDDDALVDAAVRLAERTRRAQGLPATITDPAVLDRIAALIEGGPDAA